MRICSVPGCGQKHRSNGYCQKHRDQMRYHGMILKRTTRDPNEIEIIDNVCKMELYNIVGEIIGETTFDLEFKPEIEQYKWHINGNGYVQCTYYDKTTGQQHEMSLHGAIIHLSGQTIPDKHNIDHKDRNKLNNLKDNLRIVTESQNQQNREVQSNNMIGLKGVNWHVRNEKWVAQIGINGNQEHLGYFDTAEDAARAYNAAAIYYFGEFAVLNIIPEGEQS